MAKRYRLSDLFYVVDDNGETYVEATAGRRQIRLAATPVLTETEQRRETAITLCRDFLYGKTGDIELVLRYLNRFHPSTWESFVDSLTDSLLHESLWAAFTAWREQYGN